jgi:hypothetical protein
MALFFGNCTQLLIDDLLEYIKRLCADHRLTIDQKSRSTLNTNLARSVAFTLDGLSMSF